MAPETRLFVVEQHGGDYHVEYSTIDSSRNIDIPLEVKKIPRFPTKDPKYVAPSASEGHVILHLLSNTLSHHHR